MTKMMKCSPDVSSVIENENKKKLKKQEKKMVEWIILAGWRYNLPDSFVRLCNILMTPRPPPLIDS